VDWKKKSKKKGVELLASPRSHNPSALRAFHGERTHICEYCRLLLRLGTDMPMRVVTMDKPGSPDELGSASCGSRTHCVLPVTGN